MLKDHSSSAIIAVRDTGRARAFYADTLGLPEAPGSSDDLLMFRTGATTLVVYPSEFAGTNKANAVVWGLGDALEETVADLRNKGVTFERYDMDGAVFEDGVHRMGDFRAVWFKDPDGNILHINSGD